jgi:hypothetical protein
LASPVPSSSHRPFVIEKTRARCRKRVFSSERAEEGVFLADAEDIFEFAIVWGRGKVGGYWRGRRPSGRDARLKAVAGNENAMVGPGVCAGVRAHEGGEVRDAGQVFPRPHSSPPSPLPGPVHPQFGPVHPQFGPVHPQLTP